jgi:glycosyltransferase involved in cell wall biosynthesis
MIKVIEMKVCDIVTNPIWYDPRVKKQILEYYQASDVVLECVGVRNNGRYKQEEVDKIPCPVNLITIDAKYYRSTRTVFTKIARELMTIRKLRDAVIATQADVIHANDLDALVPAYLASKKLKCVLIYDTHEIFLENNNITDSKFKKIFWRTWESKIIRKVDLVICVSHAAAEYLAKKYNIKKPMVITNCVKKVGESVVNSPNAEKFEILNHGQFYAGRGYDIMVNAATLLTDCMNVELVLRGFGRMEEQLKTQIQEEQLSNIRIDPPVHLEELIPMAARSHVGVAITEPICLNFELTVSNKIFEYAAAGLPVIMSDIPEHRYLNEKYHLGIILAENTPTCFADAVRQLASSPELYNEMRNGALRLAKEVNWENEFAKLLTCERALVKDKQYA